MEISSKFKKRAIQFGTRLAKLSNVKCFGSNRKAKGTHEYQWNKCLYGYVNILNLLKYYKIYKLILPLIKNNY